ncbi:hypothetical protein IKF20_01410, partial [Candidatus Saccharibacteria bacterium]|nr:hypothetical protein [Candidatus Saccharibacteria bacterium]
PTPAPKDAENLERIDENIHEDIAEDVGTDEVKVTPTPTEEVEAEAPTEQPKAEEYQGTEAEIVQNEASEKAEPVQDQVSSNNDYSQNRGGANSGQYAPVKPDNDAQAKADKAEIPQSQAPTGGEELDEALDDLGIN